MKNSNYYDIFIVVQAVYLNRFSQTIVRVNSVSDYCST